MDFYFSSLLLGAGIGLSYEEYGIEREKITKYRYIVGLLSLILAIFFGGYPSGIIPNHGVYNSILLTGKWLEKSFFVYHWIAAFLLILAIINLPFLKIILESKLVLLFGKYSYLFYLFHNLVRKVMDPFYWKIFGVLNGNRGVTIIICGTMNFIIICITCFVYSKTISKVENELRQYILKRI